MAPTPIDLWGQARPNKLHSAREHRTQRSAPRGHRRALSQGWGCSGPPGPVLTGAEACRAPSHVLAPEQKFLEGKGRRELIFLALYCIPCFWFTFLCFVGAQCPLGVSSSPAQRGPHGSPGAPLRPVLLLCIWPGALQRQWGLRGSGEGAWFTAPRGHSQPEKSPGTLPGLRAPPWKARQLVRRGLEQPCACHPPWLVGDQSGSQIP